jgi:glycosyltransferase involved in cell wall biosynthesis
LIPAHNESTGLLPTLADVKAQLRRADRILVVADNCTDDTRAVAAAAGADVIDRNDPDRRGKGYALAAGLRHLGLDPPDVVVIVDADCRLDDTAIDRLAAVCAATQRPVQALYLMTAPDESAINSRVAEFAWRVKNWARPLGLRALGLPCQLMGTGMAFQWNTVRPADLASGSIVEDLKLGLDLALAGNPPVFCPSARVTSDFPSSAGGVQTQRLRWERGHIGIIVTAAPRLILAAVTRANLDLLALALDVAVPPLSLLGMLVIGMWMAAGLAALLGLSSAALLVSTTSLATFAGGVFLSWLKYGRDILPPRAIWLIGAYAIGKLPLYSRILSRKSGGQWIRTDRRKI